jgi:hypothetical protein
VKKNKPPVHIPFNSLPSPDDLSGESRKRCVRTVRRTLDFLKSANIRSEIKQSVILPSHPWEKAPVLPTNSITNFLFSIYEEKIGTACENGDAELSCLLGIQLGQAIMAAVAKEAVRRGRIVVAGQRSGSAKRTQLLIQRNVKIRERWDEWTRAGGTRIAAFYDEEISHLYANLRKANKHEIAKTLKRKGEFISYETVRNVIETSPKIG